MGLWGREVLRAWLLWRGKGSVWGKMSFFWKRGSADKGKIIFGWCEMAFLPGSDLAGKENTFWVLQQVFPFGAWLRRPGGQGGFRPPPYAPLDPLYPLQTAEGYPRTPLVPQGALPLVSRPTGSVSGTPFGLAWGQQPIGCRGGYAPCMAPMPGRVPLHRGAAVAVPCHHSKDKPAPMEPGEGSAAPKATVALPGTEVSLAGRAPARLAVHCSLATGGPGAATRHAPFGRPRRPLGTFPRGESTSSARRRAKPPTGNRFLVKAGKGFYFFFLSQGLCGGDQGAFRSPPGPLRGPSLYGGENSHKKQISCGRQETGLPFFLPYHKGFRLCGGDQGAFRSPPGPLRGPSLYAWAKPPTRNRFLAEGKAKAFLSFLRITDRITPKLLPTLSLIRSPCPGLLLNPPISRQ